MQNKNKKKPAKILKTTFSCNTRYFRVEFDDGSREWVKEDKLDKAFIDKYYETHTKQGRKRKRQKKIYGLFFGLRHQINKPSTSDTCTYRIFICLSTTGFVPASTFGYSVEILNLFFW